MTSPDENGIRVQSVTAVLTYNGQWGVLARIPEESHILETNYPWREWVAEVRKIRRAQQLWTEFREFVEVLAKRWSVTYWAACCEICTETYHDSKLLRLHCHLFLKRREGRMILTLGHRHA